MKNPSSTREAQLLETASSFCQALLENPPPPPSALIRQFFVSSNPVPRGSKQLLNNHNPSPPRITEHGPEWARSRLPFLAKTFTGVLECLEYFTLLSKTLKMHMGKDTFPSIESGGFVVDAEARVEREDEDEDESMLGAVSVVGKARFESVKTGKDWEEQFIYRFSGFDKEGKIGHWEIWADPLSAWVACE
ncbi:hypothetical protein EG329_012692 [Mollisiaceae sp. DMI_Dod_QoI]|nr:hypothetical protein EG329_012692 [Helotiales sp. DMI_Dod_QoI]